MEEELLAVGKQPAPVRLTADGERRQLRAGAETRAVNRSVVLAALGFVIVLYGTIGYGPYLAVTANPVSPSRPRSRR